MGVAVVALVAAGGASAADASVIFSENFASSVGGNYGAPSVIPNSQFYVSAGNIDLIGTPSGSPFSCVDNPGGNCVDLVGAFANGGITSTPTFLLVAGDTYTVSFGSNLQGFSATDTAMTTFQVSLGDLSQTETLTAADGDKAFSITFSPTANETGASLSFLSLTAPDAVHGAVIDNIVLTQTPEIAVPEPSSWAIMLAGFGAIGARIRTRRKATRMNA
ncbi:MAG TPA: PEPxxWA-CTERM sorting domain-containing protein [Acetobacteraceae bacterium]